MSLDPNTRTRGLKMWCLAHLSLLSHNEVLVVHSFVPSFGFWVVPPPFAPQSKKNGVITLEYRREYHFKPHKAGQVSDPPYSHVFVNFFFNFEWFLRAESCHQSSVYYPKLPLQIVNHSFLWWCVRTKSKEPQTIKLLHSMELHWARTSRNVPRRQITPSYHRLSVSLC